MAYSILIHSLWGLENRRNNNTYIDLTMGWNYFKKFPHIIPFHPYDNPMK